RDTPRPHRHGAAKRRPAVPAGVGVQPAGSALAAVRLAALPLLVDRHRAADRGADADDDHRAGPRAGQLADREGAADRGLRAAGLLRVAREDAPNPAHLVRRGGGDVRVHLYDRAGTPPARVPGLMAQNAQPWLPATAPSTVISESASSTRCIRSIRAKSRAGSGEAAIRL